MKFLPKAAVLSCIIVIFGAQTAIAQDYYDTHAEAWEITSFHSEIFINEDGLVEIQETILADFTNEAHRGVERSIPYEYEGGYNSQIKFVSATDENGEPWDTDPYKSYGYLYIPMKTQDDSQIHDKATFVLTYTAKNVVTFFDDHDEFYWNVNGTDWVVPTNQITATVHLPTEASQMKCMTGLYGEEKYDCKWKQDGNGIIFTSTTPLKAYENLTIVAGLPPGTIAQPSELEKTWWTVRENLGILLAPLTFLIMFTLWYKRGRDDKTVKDTVMPHYKPPMDLLPSETGTIVDENVDPRDITSTIIDHAIKGNIRIKEISEKGWISKKTDYELELIKPWDYDKEYENDILKAIFGSNKKGAKKKISELQNKFYTHVKPIKKAIANQLIKDGYFPHNPMSVRSLYMTIGGTITILSLHLMGLLAVIFSGTAIAGIVISGIIIMIFGHFMPRKTRKGTEVYYQLKGLYEYIDTAEKDRMKFQEDNNIMFEKLLPYAVAFGLTKKWAQAFEGLIKSAPVWFIAHGTWGDGFTMTNFANRLNTFNYKTTSNITSRPGGKGGGGWSGGSGFSGGFSGGGFGGGGGRGL